MILVLDRNKVIRSELSNDAPGTAVYFDDDHHSMEKNGYATYEFSCVAHHEAVVYLENEGYVSIKDSDGSRLLFKVKEIENDHKDGQAIKRVFTENAAVGEIGTGRVIMPSTLSGTVVNAATDYILDGTGWVRGVTEFAGSRTIHFEEPQNALKALHHMKSIFGLKVRFRVQFIGSRVAYQLVDLVQSLGEETGQVVELGHDLKGIRRIENTQNLYTALYGYATDNDGEIITFESVEWRVSRGDPVDKPIGQAWVGDPDALQRWKDDGKHIFGEFSIESEEEEQSNQLEEITPEEVLQQTWDELQDRINAVITYEVESSFLEKLPGYDHMRRKIGDALIIKDTSFSPPLTLEARIIELHRSQTDAKQGQHVFGDYREVFLHQPPFIKRIQDRLRRQGNLISGKATVHQGPEPPEDKSKLWMDTSRRPHIWKRWDEETGEWVKATPTQAFEVDAYNRNEVDDRTSQAKQDAMTYAEEILYAAELEIDYALGDLGQTQQDIIATVESLETAQGNISSAVSDLESAQSSIENTISNIEQAQSSLEQTVQNGKEIWDKADNFNPDGTLDTSKLEGKVDIEQLTVGTLLGYTFESGLIRSTTLESVDGTFTGSLSAATGTFSGQLLAASGTFTGDLEASGGTFAGTLQAVDGEFTGELKAATGTFTGELQAANGVFTGNLEAAGGTFAGKLQAVDGDFTGTLQGVNGTFVGELIAASGTFTGELVAASGTFAGTLEGATIKTSRFESLEGDEIYFGSRDAWEGRIDWTGSRLRFQRSPENYISISDYGEFAVWTHGSRFARFEPVDQDGYTHGLMRLGAATLKGLGSQDGIQSRNWNDDGYAGFTASHYNVHNGYIQMFNNKTIRGYNSGHLELENDGGLIQIRPRLMRFYLDATSQYATLYNPEQNHIQMNLANNGIKGLDSTHGVQVRNVGDTSFRAITASAFNEGSRREFKENIAFFDDNALDMILNLPIYSYDMIDSEEDRKIGPLFEQSPYCIKQMGNSIHQQSYTSLAIKGIQEQQEAIDWYLDLIVNLTERIEALEEAA